MMKFLKWCLISYPWNALILWLVLTTCVLIYKKEKTNSSLNRPNPETSNVTLSPCYLIDPEVLMERMLEFAGGENPEKAKIALKRLGELGEVVHEKLPELEIIAQEHPNDEIRKLAQQSISKIEESINEQE